MSKPAKSLIWPLFVFAIMLMSSTLASAQQAPVCVECMRRGGFNPAANMLSQMGMPGLMGNTQAIMSFQQGQLGPSIDPAQSWVIGQDLPGAFQSPWAAVGPSKYDPTFKVDQSQLPAFWFQ